MPWSAHTSPSTRAQERSPTAGSSGCSNCFGRPYGSHLTPREPERWLQSRRLNGYETERVRLGVVRREPDKQDVGRELAGKVIQSPGQEHFGLGIAVPIGIGRLDVEVAHPVDRGVPTLNRIRRRISESRRLKVRISLSRKGNRRPATDGVPVIVPLTTSAFTDARRAVQTLSTTLGGTKNRAAGHREPGRCSGRPATP